MVPEAAFWPGRHLARGNEHHDENEEQRCCRVVQSKDKTQHIADCDKLHHHSCRRDGDLPMQPKPEPNRKGRIEDDQGGGDRDVERCQENRVHGASSCPVAIRSRSSASTLVTDSSSNGPVGSSRSKTGGHSRSALTSAKRCFSPVDSR